MRGQGSRLKALLRLFGQRTKSVSREREVSHLFVAPLSNPKATDMQGERLPPASDTTITTRGVETRQQKKTSCREKNGKDRTRAMPQPWSGVEKNLRRFSYFFPFRKRARTKFHSCLFLAKSNSVGTHAAIVARARTSSTKTPVVDAETPRGRWSEFIELAIFFFAVFLPGPGSSPVVLVRAVPGRQAQQTDPRSLLRAQEAKERVPGSEKKDAFPLRSVCSRHCRRRPSREGQKGERRKK